MQHGLNRAYLQGDQRVHILREDKSGRNFKIIFVAFYFRIFASIEQYFFLLLIFKVFTRTKQTKTKQNKTKQTNKQTKQKKQQQPLLPLHCYITIFPSNI